MNLFFDTSALVKFFHEEEGTGAVTTLILDPNNQIWIVELARIEFRSAVFRRFRNKELTEEKLDQSLISFEKQLTTFHIETLGRAVVNEASSLLDRYGKTHGLRTLDALQLGAFSLIAEEDGWCFVAADPTLLKVAKILEFETINPLKMGKLSLEDPRLVEQ
jgi:uncharacterized protein with PIN domain